MYLSKIPDVFRLMQFNSNYYLKRKSHQHCRSADGLGCVSEQTHNAGIETYNVFIKYTGCVAINAI